MLLVYHDTCSNVKCGSGGGPGGPGSNFVPKFCRGHDFPARCRQNFLWHTPPPPLHKSWIRTWMYLLRGYVIQEHSTSSTDRLIVPVPTYININYWLYLTNSVCYLPNVHNLRNVSKILNIFWSYVIAGSIFFVLFLVDFVIVFPTELQKGNVYTHTLSYGQFCSSGCDIEVFVLQICTLVT